MSTESIKQRRDRLAQDYADVHAVFTKELYGNICEDFKAGFNAGLQDEVVKALVDTLEAYNEITWCCKAVEAYERAVKEIAE